MITLRPREKTEEKEKPIGDPQSEEKKPIEEKPVKKVRKNYQKITKNS